MNKKKKVLVILAHFNGQEFISDQINSIISQDNVEIFLHITDDCSNLKNKSFLKNLIKHQKIRLHEFDRQSGSAGQNFLRIFETISFVNYDYIALSDQDDVWDNDKLYRAISSLDKFKCDSYSSSVNAFWPSGKKKILRQSSDLTQYDFLFEGAGQGCTFVIRKDFFSNVQNFIRKNKHLLQDFHYHDWFIYILSRTLNKKWFFDPLPSMFYRQHHNNDTGAKASIASIIKRLELIRKGWYKNQIIIAGEIALTSNPQNTKLKKICTLINSKKSISRSLKLLFLVILNGRRKISDRIVLSLSVIFGHI